MVKIKVKSTRRGTSSLRGVNRRFGPTRNRSERLTRDQQRRATGTFKPGQAFFTRPKVTSFRRIVNPDTGSVKTVTTYADGTVDFSVDGKLVKTNVFFGKGVQARDVKEPSLGIKSQGELRAEQLARTPKPARSVRVRGRQSVRDDLVSDDKPKKETLFQFLDRRSREKKKQQRGTGSKPKEQMGQPASLKPKIVEPKKTDEKESTVKRLFRLALPESKEQRLTRRKEDQKRKSDIGILGESITKSEQSRRKFEAGIDRYRDRINNIPFIKKDEADQWAKQVAKAVSRKAVGLTAIPADLSNLAIKIVNTGLGTINLASLSKEDRKFVKGEIKKMHDEALTVAGTTVKETIKDVPRALRGDPEAIANTLENALFVGLTKAGLTKGRAKELGKEIRKAEKQKGQTTLKDFTNKQKRKESIKTRIRQAKNPVSTFKSVIDRSVTFVRNKAGEVVGKYRLPDGTTTFSKKKWTKEWRKDIEGAIAQAKAKKDAKFQRELKVLETRIKERNLGIDKEALAQKSKDFTKRLEAEKQIGQQIRETRFINAKRTFVDKVNKIGKDLDRHISILDKRAKKKGPVGNEVLLKTRRAKVSYLIMIRRFKKRLAKARTKKDVIKLQKSFGREWVNKVKDIAGNPAVRLTKEIRTGEAILSGKGLDKFFKKTEGRKFKEPKKSEGKGKEVVGPDGTVQILKEPKRKVKKTRQEQKQQQKQATLEPPTKQKTATKEKKPTKTEQVKEEPLKGKTKSKKKEAVEELGKTRAFGRERTKPESKGDTMVKTDQELGGKLKEKTKTATATDTKPKTDTPAKVSQALRERIKTLVKQKGQQITKQDVKSIYEQVGEQVKVQELVTRSGKKKKGRFPGISLKLRKMIQDQVNKAIKNKRKLLLAYTPTLAGAGQVATRTAGRFTGFEVRGSVIRLKPIKVKQHKRKSLKNKAFVRRHRRRKARK